jgi:hypothetical protein
MNIIGYDPGFGNTKVCFNGVDALVQSAVARPRSTGMATIGMKSAGKGSDLVTFDGQNYAVGAGSWNRGEPLTSLDYNSLVSTGRMAMFYAAMSRVVPSDAPSTLVVGLPVSLLQDAEQAKTVIEALKLLKREHFFAVNGNEYMVSIDKIKVLAQPVGAYMDWLYDDRLTPRVNGKAEVAVIDIGFNTLDIYALANGQVMERFLGGSEVGVFRLLEQLSSEMDLAEADAQLRSGAINPDGYLSAWMDDVLANIKRTVKNLKRFNSVILCGGGSVILGNRLKVALESKGATVFVPVHPVSSNVRGFWKYGAKNGSSR